MSAEEVDSRRRISLNHVLVSLFHQVVNHGSDDAGVGMEFVNPNLSSTVRLESPTPFVNDKEVHPAEESVKDDKASDDFKDEDNPLSFVYGVSSLDTNSHSHVEDSDDNGSLHFDYVEEGQRVFIQIPGWVDSEGVDAVISNVVTHSVLRTSDLPRFERRRGSITGARSTVGIRSTVSIPDEFHGKAVLSQFISISSTCWCSVDRLDGVVDVVTSLRCSSIVYSSVSDCVVETGAEPVVRDSEELVVEQTVVHGAHTQGEHEVAER